MKNLIDMKDKDGDLIKANKDSFIQVIVEMHQKLGETFESNFNKIREINYKINQDIEQIQNLITNEEKIQKDLQERNSVINNVLNDFMNTMQATINDGPSNK
ncbi:hypothetical protein cpbgf_4001105 [Cryptosporidium parvum]|uniref:Uncharacterized protein n=1 Tax=Cryptosporidium parvum TaxID=5807 RepID=A0A7S7LGL5_CRYPV|nr:hypothetical protein CPATCC_0018220 [Cryptosporidium parvum]WRK32027.1 hypothetical protein cpbgf_4001105 [Cryptosporidium parvum]|eukprot:QOY41999.1 hypothetical protein CPATCC_001593 [Cryptosporidium parvum]